MKKLIVCGLVLGMLLCGCGSKPAETTVPTTVPVPTAAPTEAATVPTTAATEAPTTVPTEPAPVDVNPLTGEPLDAVSDQRPIAVMVNNFKAALPQCGIGKADILYEILAEGDITRFCAYFTNPADAGPIGPVRSLRAYYLNIMRGYDAICVAAGASPEADNLVYSLGYDRINGLGGAGAGYFYRDEWRKNNRGYEHSMFVKGEDLLKGAADGGKRLTETEGRNYGLFFDDDAPFGGAENAEIDIHFISSKNTRLTYDPELGCYTAFQQGQDLIDANTDEKLTFRNVVVLHAATSVYDEKGRRSVQTTGENTGLYARDGKVIEITWKRASDTAPYEYYDLQGNPVTFGVGKSYIAIIPESATVDLTPAAG